MRQISVVLGALAFLAICWWAFSPKRKKRFEEDAKLPFADEEPSADKDEDASATAAQGGETKAGNESGTQQKQGQDKQ